MLAFAFKLCLNEVCQSGMHMSIGDRGIGDWDDVRVFLAVVRSGSYSRAAAMLGIRQSTVSRRVRALEERLGVKLFDHMGHGMRPTPAADGIQPSAERMEQQVQAIEREVLDADTTPHGTVRVTGPDWLLTWWLAPRLSELQAHYPELRVEFLTARGRLDLGAREADVALRLDQPREPRLVADELAAVDYSFFAGRAYVETDGAPSCPEEVYDHPLIDVHDYHEYDHDGAWQSFVTAHPRVVARMDSLTAVAEALRARAGVAALPPLVARRCQDLVPLRAGPGFHRRLYLVSHEETRASARIRAVCEFLSAFREQLQDALTPPSVARR